VYAAGAGGNVAPTRTIAGSSTGLSTPTGIALDASGNIYVTTNGNRSVVVFAPSASGNVTPLRTIEGGATGLANPLLLAIGR
jgi:sugar lactone lactonase YvrE